MALSSWVLGLSGGACGSSLLQEFDLGLAPDCSIRGVVRLVSVCFVSGAVLWRFSAVLPSRIMSRPCLAGVLRLGFHCLAGLAAA